MRSLARLALFGSLFALPLVAGAAGALAPGSPAPTLSVKTWYKGAPVTEIEKDRTYVVEFWATWCGPCIESIPHVTELAKKNPDVTFVGVSIWEEDKDGNIEKFIEKMGEKMDYHVGYSGNKDGMAKTWMEAAGQNGIPSAFIVKDGTIQWVGHPMEMEKPLAEVKAGTFDLAKFKVEFEKTAAKNRERMAAQKALSEAQNLFQSGKRKQAHAALDAALAKYPSQTAAGKAIRFDWLADESPAAWEKQAKAMAASKNPEERESLSSFALNRAQTTAGAPIARKAMAMALKGEGGNDFLTLWYATEVYAATKDVGAQLNATKRILAVMPKTQFKDNKEMKEKFLSDLASLQKKVATKGK